MAFSTIDLGGIWQFKEYPLDARKISDLDALPWHEASVPGSIYDCLEDAQILTAAQVLRDPRQFDHVSHKPWIFSKTFQCDNAFIEADDAELVFDCLDTIATVWLNEKIVGRTANMFMTQRIKVKEFLRAGANRILVKFDPPMEYARKQCEKFGRGNFTNMPVQAFIRKAYSHFGQDNNAIPVGCGILGPCRLEAVKQAGIEELNVRTVDASAHFADVRVAIKLAKSVNRDFKCRMIFAGGVVNLSNEIVFEAGQDFQSTLFRIERPFLWWPRGHGVQFLYDLKVELLADEEIIDSVSRQIGVCTIKVNKDDPDAQSVFEVNGRNIYIKGATWTGLSATSSRITETDYKHMLGLAVQANINLLRVSGISGYETPLFYELCDRLGIMVWQDMAFAGQCYPDKPFFTSQIEQEIPAVVKMLRKHACMAGFSACADIPSQPKLTRSSKIFATLIKQIISELDPSAVYVDNSANSVVFKPLFDLHRDCPAAIDYFSSPQPNPPFVSASGLASSPTIAGIENFFGKRCQDIDLAQFESLASENILLSRLYQYTGEIFGLCKSVTELAMRSQLVTARLAKFQAEGLRASGKNSGLVIWQLSDKTPAIDFGAIDSFRRPKALYYYMRRFFAPLIVTAITRNEHTFGPAIEVNAVNDTASPITANIEVKLVEFNGSIIDHTCLPVSMSPFSISPPFKLPREIAMPKEPRKVFLELVMRNDEKVLSQNTYLYAPDKFLNYPCGRITHKLQRADEVTYKLHLQADTFIKDLYIDIPTALHVWDNFLDLVPGREQIVNITVGKSVSLESDKVNLTHL